MLLFCFSAALTGARPVLPLTSSCPVGGGEDPLSALAPDGGDDDPVAGADDDNRQDKEREDDEGHVQLPVPGLRQSDPALRRPWP